MAHRAAVTSGNGAATSPSELEQLCRSCQDYVSRALGFELDYTSDTLPLLDHYLISARTDVAGRPELERLLARVVGAYFGEVLVRQLGLFWRMPSADEYRWRVCGRDCFLAVNPVGIAHANLSGSVEHAGPSSELMLAQEDQEFVRERLASLPEVRDEDFFLFSTRYDALEVACAALAEQKHHDGQADISFESDDYDEFDVEA